MTRLEPDDDERVGQLRSHFFQWREVNPAVNIYVLLDQNHPVHDCDELHCDQLAKREVQRSTSLVLRPDRPHEPGTLPLLLQLFAAGENGYADETLLELTLHNALVRCRSVNGAYVAAWLCCSCDINTLSAHLARSGIVFATGEGRQRFLPLFEPYRMALLSDDEQAASFLSRWFGPVKHWMFVDSSSALRVVGPPPPTPTPTPTPIQKAAPVLRREQFAAQERVDVARFVVLALDKDGVMMPLQPERRIDQVIAEAQAQGLRETEDIVFYALNCFTIGMDWSSHPQATALIRQTVADPGLRLAAQLSALPDHVLSDIASWSDRRH